MFPLLKIRGAREHNLRDVDLDLPRNGLIGLAGVSGSGKSSLALDTLFREGQRRYLETLSPRARRLASAMDRADVDRIEGLRPAVALDQHARAFSKRSSVATLTEIHDHLATLFVRFGTPHCPRCEQALEPQSAERISERICTEFEGRRALVLAPLEGLKRREVPALLAKLRDRGFARIRIDGVVERLESEIRLPPRGLPKLEAVLDRIVPEASKRARVHEAVEQALELSKGFVRVAEEGGREELYASARACPTCRIDLPPLDAALFSFHGARGACPSCRGRGEGAIPGAACIDCAGTRLRVEARAVRWHGLRFDAFLQAHALDALALWQRIELKEREQEHGASAYRQIKERLQVLEQLGLGYLPLLRSGRALSNGEAQRVRLAAHLGARLRDVLYVLDEPSAGLHPREVDILIRALRELCDRGNTVLVVEHDLRFLRALDWLVELGPGAGADGGKVIASARPAEIAATLDTPTARAWRDAQRSVASVPHRDPATAPKLVLRGARGQSLRGDDFALPLGALVAVCGVSGSGKSTLCLRTLVPALASALGTSEATGLPFDTLEGHAALARVIAIDGRVPQRSARSDVATVCGIAGALRELLAETPEARWRGFTAKRFSSRISERRGGGRCEACQGLGRRTLPWARAAALPASCDQCDGTHYSAATRTVRFGGLDIVGWLALRVEEAAERLRDQAGPRRILDALRRLGLSYLVLGQRTSDLSGGELQRLKIAAEFARPAVRNTLYVIDEPTRGLHPADVHGLIQALNDLVDRGDSVLVIEHDEQVLRAAHWMIEMGPGAGEHGGHIVAAGTPAEIAARAHTETGRFLASDAPAFATRDLEGSAAPTALAVRGARLHNLRAIDASFPREGISIVTGPSGSGKSTLLFDVLHAEARRGFLESLGAGPRRRLGQLMRAPHDGIEGLPPTIAIDARDGSGEAGRDLADLAEVARDVAQYFARVAVPHCPEHGEVLGKPEPAALAARVIEAWNGEKGYLCVPWPRQGGAHDEAALAGQREMLLAQGFLRALVDGEERRLDDETFAAPSGVELHLVFDRVSFEERSKTRIVEAIEAARSTAQQRVSFVRRRSGSANAVSGIDRFDFDLSGACIVCSTTVPEAWNDRHLLRDKRWSRALRLTRDEMEAPVTLRDWLELPFSDLADEVTRERRRARAARGERAKVAERWLPALSAKLKTLLDLGLGHLDAARDAASLSSGELRRMRLVAASVVGLDGLCAIFDEPSVGLHTKDLDALWSVLQQWRSAGNTLLIVEHAEELIERADYVLELGPGAGSAGGTVVASGTPQALSSGATATGRALRGEFFALAQPAIPRSAVLRLQGARTRNLQGIDIELRAGSITAVSGVSGAGKSSLLLGTLVPAFASSRTGRSAESDSAETARYSHLEGAASFEACHLVDDQPLARTRRATVAQQLGTWDRLRTLWSRVPEARARGYSARTFSFGGTAQSGACSVCRGLGERRMDAGFLADLWQRCEECGGARFRSEVLEVKWRGQSIADALDMELHAAAQFFEEHPSLVRSLEPALAVGLQHLKLGQSLSALSGGELQRIKLARAFEAGASTTPQVFVLDEPSQGLHAVDVAALAHCLEALAQRGHAVALIEHDPLLLWRAHTLYDLGTGGGVHGGQLLFSGAPAELAEQRDLGRGGATGEALRRARDRAQGKSARSSRTSDARPRAQQPRRKRSR